MGRSCHTATPVKGPLSLLYYHSLKPIRMIQLKTAEKISILIADDDADDRDLIKAAFDESSTQHRISFVENGEELLHYLKRNGHYADESLHPFPQIILLDLNMPKKDGREALKELKTDVIL